MNISVGKRLAIGFAIMTLLIVAPAAAIYWWTGQVRDSQRQVLEVSQPTVAAAAAVRDGLHQSQAGLRGYMAIGSEPFQRQHHEGWRQAEENLTKLESQADTWPEKDRELLKRLRAELGDVASIHGAVADACGQNESLPVAKKLVDETSPLGDRMLAALGGVIAIETTLEKTPRRQALLRDLTNLRDSFHSGLVEMHSYLTTAAGAHADNFRRQWQADDAALVALAAKGRLLTPEQTVKLGEFRRLRAQFQPMPEQLFAIRDSKAFNVANQRLENDAAPREATAEALLAKLISRQQTAAGKAQQTLHAQSALLSGMSLGGPGVAAILGIFIGWSVTRRVTRPLKQTMRSLESVAAGKKTQSLPENNKDEFGRMATAINALAKAQQDIPQEAPENQLDHQRLREFMAADARRRRPFSRPQPVASEEKTAEKTVETSEARDAVAIFQDIIHQAIATANQVSAESGKVVERSRQAFDDAETTAPAAAEATIEAMADAGFRQELADETQKLADSSEQLRTQATQLTALMGRLQANMPTSTIEEETVQETTTTSHAAQAPMKGPKAGVPGKERVQETV